MYKSLHMVDSLPNNDSGAVGGENGNVYEESIDIKATSKLSSDDCNNQFEKPRKEDHGSSFWFSWRMLIILIVFMGVNLHNIMRNMAGITMICMVNSTSVAFDHNEIDDHGFFYDNNSSLIFSMTHPNYNLSTFDYSNLSASTTVGFGSQIFHKNNGQKPRQQPIDERCVPSEQVQDEYHHGRYNWSNKEQGYIFAGLSWGQLLTVFPAGLYSDKYSNRKLVTFAFVLGGICTCLVPFVAEYGYMAMIGLRFFLGLYAGMLFPCLNSIVVHWVPASEISTMYAIVTGGNQLSMVLFMPFSAFMCKQRHILGGWPATHYLFGVISLIFACCWWLLVTDYPDQHKFISQHELEYIKQTRKYRVTKETRKQFKHPYRQVLFSPPSLACALCMSAGMFGVTCLTTYLPTYLRDVMLMDLNSNGEASASPFLSQLLIKLTSSHLADRLKRQHVNSNLIVKSFNTVGLFSLAIFLFAMTFLDCTQSALVIILICIALGLYACVSPGFLASSLLIAPRHTGLLTAWCNLIATLGQLAVPYLVGFLVVKSTVEEWRLVFAVGCVYQIFAAIFFLIFGAAEEQSWAKESTAEHHYELEQHGWKNDHHSNHADSQTNNNVNTHNHMLFDTKTQDNGMFDNSVTISSKV